MAALPSTRSSSTAKQFAVQGAAPCRTQQIVTDGTPTTTNYTYNAANQLTSDGVHTLTYDNNGNPLRAYRSPGLDSLGGELLDS